MEHADVVIVGGRLAGCAVGAPLARMGRKVIAIDRMTFPSDQLSTHLLMPAGVSELARLGALPRIMELNPSQVRHVRLRCEGVELFEDFRPEQGIDFGVCIPRPQQDLAVVEAAKEQGLDHRTKCTFEALRWRAGRVCGITYRDEDGELHEVEATLTIGADGRRSNVAAQVGAWTPYRLSQNGRGLVFRYVDDPRPDTVHAETYELFRDGDSFAFAFPSAPKGKLLILFMGHRDEASEVRKDPDAYWQRKLAEHPGIADRIAGSDPASFTKWRSTGETPAFFRASSGPGWALAGDAAHFKDPVTGQGMRDAMWMGRTLAEHVLPHLDDPAAVDMATRRWERHRDEHCLPAYHFANLETRVERQPPAVVELFRDGGRSTAPDISDLFGRARTFHEIAPLPRLVRAVGSALVRRERSARETLTHAVDHLRFEADARFERRFGGFRATRPVHSSDHPGASWPAAPRVAATAAAPVPAPTQPAEEAVAA